MKNKKDDSESSRASSPKSKPADRSQKKPAAKKTDQPKPKAESTAEPKTVVDETAGVVANTLENVEAGMRVVSEKAATIVGSWFQQLKKGATKAVDSSARIADDLSNSAVEMGEKVKGEALLREKQRNRDTLAVAIGDRVYEEYSIKGKVKGDFFEATDILETVADLKSIEKDIVTIEQKLKK